MQPRKNSPQNRPPPPPHLLQLIQISSSSQVIILSPNKQIPTGKQNRALNQQKVHIKQNLEFNQNQNQNYEERISLGWGLGWDRVGGDCLGVGVGVEREGLGVQVGGSDQGYFIDLEQSQSNYPVKGFSIYVKLIQKSLIQQDQPNQQQPMRQQQQKAARKRGRPRHQKNKANMQASPTQKPKKINKNKNSNDKRHLNEGDLEVQNKISNKKNYQKQKEKQKQSQKEKFYSEQEYCLRKKMRRGRRRRLLVELDRQQQADLGVNANNKRKQPEYNQFGWKIWKNRQQFQGISFNKYVIKRFQNQQIYNPHAHLYPKLPATNYQIYFPNRQPSPILIPQLPQPPQLPQLSQQPPQSPIVPPQKIDLSYCSLSQLINFCYKENILTENIYNKFVNFYIDTEENQRYMAQCIMRGRTIQAPFNRRLFTVLDHRLFTYLLMLDHPGGYQLSQGFAVGRDKVVMGMYRQIYAWSVERYDEQLTKYNKTYQRQWMPTHTQHTQLAPIGKLPFKPLPTSLPKPSLYQTQRKQQRALKQLRKEVKDHNNNLILEKQVHYGFKIVLGLNQNVVSQVCEGKRRGDGIRWKAVGGSGSSGRL